MIPPDELGSQHGSVSLRAGAVEIARVARNATHDRAAAAPLDLASPPSGGLQDDTSIMVCRPTGVPRE
jgi:hypothetical protein